MTLAIASIQRNRNPYIVEWIAFHLAVGFDQFYIYAHKTDDGMAETLLKLSEKYPIQVFAFDADDWPQIIAYNHAWTSFGKQVDWMAFIDGDEFLFPTHHDSMGEALAAYRDKRLSALGVYWKCYGSNGHIAEPAGMLIENYPRHSDGTFEANRHIKSIVKGGEAITNYRSHLFDTVNGTVDEHLRPITHGLMAEYEPTYDVFRINHYVTQSYEYFKKTKQNSGAADLPAGVQRSDEWFTRHDRNDEDDGVSGRFLEQTKSHVDAMHALLNGSHSAAANERPLATSSAASRLAEMPQPTAIAAVPTVAPEGIRLFTIVYSREKTSQLIPETEPLDNIANARPDWREYWPIRRYLVDNALDDGVYYGFLSPRFPEKTGLSGNGVRRFVHDRKGPPADVYTFSPQADMGAFFLNIFEQGNAFDADLMAAAKEVARVAGISADLGALIMDSRQTVFSNYFVANKRFWTRWFEVCEQIFAICETGTTPLAETLNQATSYPGAVPRKVFVIERIASLLLAAESWSAVPYSTFNCAWSALPTSNYRDEAIVSDALKMAFNDTQDNNYLQAFSRLRSKVFGAG